MRLLLVLMIPLLVLAQSSSEDFIISKSVLNTGGGMSSSEDFQQMNAFGQSTPVGVQSSEDFLLSAGFLHPEAAEFPCPPENDQCPGITVECLPFTASGNNCCAALDWENCGISARDVFFNYTPLSTTTARLSLCDSPESWDTCISIYQAGANGSCTDSFRVGCLDNGCADPLHVNQLFTFEGGVTYYIVLSGYFPEDCGTYVLNITDETDYSQPDTLAYDSNYPAIWYLEPYWGRKRFTAPETFELRSVYTTVWGGTSCADRCSLYVYDAPPAPGGEITQAVAPVPQSEFFKPVWMSVHLDEPVTISAGSEFWIGFGPVPGYFGNWKIPTDNSQTGDRNQVSIDGLYGTYVTSRDYLLRAGGVLISSPDSLVIRNADNSEDIELNWSPALNADQYNIYRDTTGNVQTTPENLIGTSAAPAYLDVGVLLQPEAMYFYAVAAVRNVSLLSSGSESPEEFRSSASNSGAPYQPMQVKTSVQHKQ